MGLLHRHYTLSSMGSSHNLHHKMSYYDDHRNAGFSETQWLAIPLNGLAACCSYICADHIIMMVVNKTWIYSQLCVFLNFITALRQRAWFSPSIISYTSNIQQYIKFTRSVKRCQRYLYNLCTVNFLLGVFIAWTIRHDKLTHAVKQRPGHRPMSFIWTI